MVTVFHNKNFNNFSLIADSKKMVKTIKDEDLTKVATVSTDDLDDAFRLTNHIDHNMTLNPGVVPFVTTARSTSIGDILDLNGKKYIVSTFCPSCHKPVPNHEAWFDGRHQKHLECKDTK